MFTEKLKETVDAKHDGSGTKARPFKHGGEIDEYCKGIIGIAVFVSL